MAVRLQAIWVSTRVRWHSAVPRLQPGRCAVLVPTGSARRAWCRDSNTSRRPASSAGSITSISTGFVAEYVHFRTKFRHTPCPVKAEVLFTLASMVLKVLLSLILSSKVTLNNLRTDNYITLDEEIPLDLVKVKVRLLCEEFYKKLY